MTVEHVPSRPVLFIRSLVFSIGFNTLTVILGILTILARLFSHDVSLRVGKLWGGSNLWLLKVICKLGYEVEGAENISDRNAIVLCKHQSTWETMALHCIIPMGRWVFKRELLLFPIFGWALAATDPISINRGAGRAAVNELVTKGTKKLERGKWIIIFPEGTRTPPGPSEKYKIGGAILAEKSGYPVLPIAHNAGEFWPRAGFIKWPGTIKVRIGPLIESKGRDAKEFLDDTRQWIEASMKEISNPLYCDKL